MLFIYIASGQQPDLRVKVVADSMELLLDMFRDEYRLRKDGDASGLPEMIDNEPSRLVTHAKDMLFVPHEAASGPTPQRDTTLHGTQLVRVMAGVLYIGGCHAGSCWLDL